MPTDMMVPGGDMDDIRRYGEARRWADVVVHRGVARWVEVAEDRRADADGQTAQVLEQIDATLAQLQCDRTRLLEVLVYVAAGVESAVVNARWDAWVPAGHAPVRAMVQVGLADGCLVEMVVTAAVDAS